MINGTINIVNYPDFYIKITRRIMTLFSVYVALLMLLKLTNHYNINVPLVTFSKRWYLESFMNEIRSSPVSAYVCL